MKISARSVAVGFIAFVGCMLPSCVKSGDDAAAIVREWMGKEIVVPENLTFVSSLILMARVARNVV